MNCMLNKKNKTKKLTMLLDFFDYFKYKTCLTIHLLPTNTNLTPNNTYTCKTRDIISQLHF